MLFSTRSSPFTRTLCLVRTDIKSCKAVAHLPLAESLELPGEMQHSELHFWQASDGSDSRSDRQIQSMAWMAGLSFSFECYKF